MSTFALQIARRFEPRQLLIALAAVIASFALLHLVYERALDSLVAFKLDDSDPARQNSFPAVVTGLFLLSAAALAFATATLRGANAPWWRATGVALAFFAVDESLGLHTWADRHLGIGWAAAYVPFVAVAALVWLGTARTMGGARGAQTAFAAGLLGWLGAAALDATRTGRAEALAAGELLQMSAAALLLVGVFAYARARSLAGQPATPRGREAAVAIARAAVGRMDVRALLIGLAALAVVFGILGAIVYPGGGDLRAFDLNKEQTFPATFSGALLLAAGGLALLNGLVRPGGAAARRWWVILALVFAFLGLDEIAALHEAVQDRVNVWGQAVLAPVVVVGVYAWWKTLLELRAEQPADTIYALGAVAWIVSQGIDAAFNEHWGWTIVPEELVEMLGSALFGLALLTALRMLLAREPAPTPAPAARAEAAAPREPAVIG